MLKATSAAAFSSSSAMKPESTRSGAARSNRALIVASTAGLTERSCASFKTPSYGNNTDNEAAVTKENFKYIYTALHNQAPE